MLGVEGWVRIARFETPLQESTVVLKCVGDGRPVFLTFTGVEGLTSVLLLSGTVRLS